ncbi:HNH endonuclease [Roseobacter weihaiensis]|uniref:HNH endonuclease n=1 Tax=Roseobacter weihaiensis TaxID=2763262 RepID=UPI001D0BA984|nr:HNH endonuclease [Roseobacter sp. H9]
MSRIQRKSTKNADPHVVKQEKVAPPESNPRTRLPRSNGRWEGEPGNGTWYPDNPDAKSVLGDEGVPFKNGRPDFSQWSKGELEFEPNVLDGSDTDFTRVYEQVRQAGNLPSNNAAKEYLKQVGLTPHHHSDTVIQLIPTKLHKNIPHIGSASDMRMNF